MISMKEINGGVCAPKGFTASGIHCGIRANKAKKDLALIYSEVLCSAAATYTLNLVKGAPILVTKENIKNGYAQAVICNSGNANTCNADGIEIAEKMCELVSNYLPVKSTDVIVASTGVIGQRLSIEPIAKGMDELVKSLGDNSDDAVNAIMTTDTKKKELAIEFELDGKICKMGAIAKGSGMIHPNMATMLSFFTTDVAIKPELLQKALSAAIVDTFNMVSVDGDTSTNDTVAILANGLAGNKMIDSENEDFKVFEEALLYLTSAISRRIAKDGEGATKLLECHVDGAKTKEIARTVAKSVICSSLLKCAIFGADANWGRVLCAIGYSGADIDITKVDVSFKSIKGEILVCKDGAGVDFSEEIAKEILLEEDITVLVNLNDGIFDATAYGCDLTYEYVKINGDYRS